MFNNKQSRLVLEGATAKLREKSGFEEILARIERGPFMLVPAHRQALPMRQTLAVLEDVQRRA